MQDQANTSATAKQNGTRIEVKGEHGQCQLPLVIEIKPAANRLLSFFPIISLPERGVRWSALND
jgi:hypothetical protein